MEGDRNKIKNEELRQLKKQNKTKKKQGSLENTKMFVSTAKKNVDNSIWKIICSPKYTFNINEPNM